MGETLAAVSKHSFLTSLRIEATSHPKVYESKTPITMNSLPTAQDIRAQLNGRMYLKHCYCSPVSGAFLHGANAFRSQLQHLGAEACTASVKARFREVVGDFLRCEPDCVSFFPSLTVGLNFVSWSYPYQQEDEVLVYYSDYPSVVLPWVEATKTFGAHLRFIPQENELTAESIAPFLTPKTRVLSLSHIQFITGKVAEIANIGKLCAERGIDLIVDAAQSMGAVPVFPKEWNAAVVIAPGYKWLLGIHGAAVSYSSKEFRNKLVPRLIGPDIMKPSGSGWINYDNNPIRSAALFEYGTVSREYMAGMTSMIEEVYLRIGIEAIQKQIRSLHEVVLTLMRREVVAPLYSELPQTSILSLRLTDGARLSSSELVQRLESEFNIYMTERQDILRVAPHFYNTEEDMAQLCDALTKLL